MIFADTSFWVAVLNKRDQYHQAATDLFDGRDFQVYWSDWILLELGGYFSSRSFRAAYFELVSDLRVDNTLTLVPGSQELLEASLDLFADRPDKQWSLTDCSSFIIMNQLGITHALTSDHHFEQAGFTILLK